MLDKDRSLFVLILGDIFGDFKVTREKASGQEAAGPDRALGCIGLNYKLHAQESNAKIPEYPVLFAEGPDTV